MPDRRRLLTLAAGTTVAIIAWGYLVLQAVEFGKQGRDGSAGAWFFLFLATVGATACLFLVLLLASKLLAELRGEAPPPRPPGAAGGKRAKR